MTVLGVFAGGRGVRLYPLTKDRPKCLVEIGGDRTVLDLILDRVSTSIDRAYLMIGVGSSLIMDRYGDSYKGVGMRYLVEDEPMGTLYALRTLFDAIEQEDILLMNGDVVCDLDPEALISHSKRNDKAMTVVLKRMRSPYGIVEVKNDRVLSFAEKPLLPHLMNAGIYHIKEDLRYRMGEPVKGTNVEEYLFSTIASEGRMGYYLHDGFHASLDSMKDLDEIKAHLFGTVRS